MSHKPALSSNEGSMNKLKILILIIFVFFCWGCGDGSDPVDPADWLFTGPIAFEPNIIDGLTMDIQMEVFADNEERSVLIDTGSIYYFLGRKDNSQDLPCPSPDNYTYGGGVAFFCPEETLLEVKDIQGSYETLFPEKIKMGRAYFTEWPGPPYAIIGLSANLIGENRENMLPVVHQLEPDYLSFSFPDGLLNPGFFQFDKLQGSWVSEAQRIPLVSPDTLEYGYTARLLRIEYYANNELETAVINDIDGVYVETAETSERIADDLMAFFDTGTTIPVLIIDGGASLLSDRVPEDMILPEDDAPLYDEVVAVFEDESGLEIRLRSGNVSVWQPENPWSRVLTKPPVPEGTKHLVFILGLNFIGQYDFQFDFSGGKATHVTFVER
jgi:hypothetical protein